MLIMKSFSDDSSERKQRKHNVHLPDRYLEKEVYQQYMREQFELKAKAQQEVLIKKAIRGYHTVLNDLQKEIVRQHVVKNRAQDAIAEKLGISQQRVSYQYQRALIKLRIFMENN